MADRTKGEVRHTANGPVARVTMRGRARRTFALPTCRNDDEAQDRANLLATMVKRFRKANVLETPDADRLLEMAASATPAMLKGVLEVAAELCGGELVDANEAPDAPTFEDVGRMWVTGDLHKRFPDHVATLTEGFRDTAEKRLEKAVFPHIGSKPVTAVTRADCEEVMRLLPAPKGERKGGKLSRETRRQYAGLVNRVLNLAEFAGYIERNPLPRGWLPKPGPRKRFPILYPAEDRELLACTRIPLEWRVLWGFLHREGMRRGEAIDLRWRELDLDHGVVTLDENKTDHPRWWRLGDGVAEALAAWMKECGDVEPDDRVFTDEHGRPISLDHMADLVRRHLELAGLDRADLTTEGPNKGRFGTHCFRRSFVTLSLATDRPEDWVRARSGHKSSELLRYRQAAKGLAELDLGDVDPLNQAIPEFSGRGVARPGVGALSTPPRRGRRGETRPHFAPDTTREGGGTGRRTSLRCDRSESDPSLSREKRSDELTTTDVSERRRGETGGEIDALDRALADALTKAAAAGEWTAVEMLSREIEARRKARARVVELDVERKRRKR